MKYFFRHYNQHLDIVRMTLYRTKVLVVRLYRNSGIKVLPQTHNFVIRSTQTPHRRRICLDMDLCCFFVFHEHSVWMVWRAQVDFLDWLCCVVFILRRMPFEFTIIQDLTFAMAFQIKYHSIWQAIDWCNETWTVFYVELVHQTTKSKHIQLR